MEIVSRRPFLFAALALTFVSGCAPRESTGDGVRLRFWNGFTGPDGKTMERMVASFQKANPDIRVDMQIIPWAQYYDKLTLGLAFEKGPHVFICHANRLPEFAQYRVFKSLDSLINRSGPNGIPESDFNEQAWQAAQFEGSAYAIPLDIHPIGLYYNRKLFREAGVVDSAGEAKPPRTWDELIAAGKKLTKDLNGDGRPDQWGFAFTWLQSNWYTFAFQYGASSITPDLKRSGMNEPAALSATNRMREIVDVHKIAPKPEGLDAWLGFRQGRLAMVMEGVYMLADLEQTAGLDYGGAPVPQFGEKRAAWGGSHLMCLPARLDSTHTSAAWKLVRYLSDNSLEWSTGGQIPARKSLLNSDRFRSLRIQSAFARQLPYMQYEPLSPRFTEISPFVLAGIQAALYGLKTPESALAEAHSRIDRVLKRP